MKPSQILYAVAFFYSLHAMMPGAAKALAWVTLIAAFWLGRRGR